MDLQPIRWGVEERLAVVEQQVAELREQREAPDKPARVPEERIKGFLPSQWIIFAIVGLFGLLIIGAVILSPRGARVLDIVHELAKE